MSGKRKEPPSDTRRRKPSVAERKLIERRLRERLWSCDQSELVPQNSFGPRLEKQRGNWFSIELAKHVGPVPSWMGDHLSENMIDYLEEKKEKVVKTSIIRSRKVMIHPTEEQMIVLKRYFGASRKAYNILVEKYRFVNKGRVKIKELRDVVAEEKGEWSEGIPYEIIDSGVRDFFKARSAHVAKKKKRAARGESNESLNKARFNFRSAKRGQSSMFLRKTCNHCKTGMFAELNFQKFKLEERLQVLLGRPDMSEEEASKWFPDHDCVLKMDIKGRVFICIPLEREIVCDTQTHGPRRGIAAMDPGVRAFQTVYDTDGHIIEIGRGDQRRMISAYKTIDDLRSRIALRRNKGMRITDHERALVRLEERMHNRVRDMHKKVCRWLCETYRVVFVPKFQVSTMVKKEDRVFGPIASRSMYALGHYAFRQRLKDMAELYEGVEVVECTEEYTTQTCGRCGRRNKNVGTIEDYECPARDCDYAAGRDVNASRNILILNLAKRGVGLPRE